MPIKIYNTIGLLVLGILPSPTWAASSDRWYNSDQVKHGATVFAENCESCHGSNAESTADWRKQDAQGNYVPPPLDGSAHAWHHPMKLLRRTIQKGGKPVGGLMPAFENKLSAAEIDAAIAWFQAKWSDEIYASWASRNKDTGFQLLKPKESSQNPLTELLRQRLPGVVIGEPQKTAVSGLYQAKVGDDFVYLFEQGHYAIIGELIDLKAGENLTRQEKNTAQPQ